MPYAQPSMSPATRPCPQEEEVQGQTVMTHLRPQKQTTNNPGWGEYIAPSLTTAVKNVALAGRSARSYTREGHFNSLASQVQQDDFVVIEFGHNDGGSLSDGDDNGRTDCPGDGEETCTTTYDGQPETVLTFAAYVANAAKMLTEKGAQVLVSSQTPNNVWETGVYEYAASRFVEGARRGAQAARVGYVDHGAYVAARYRALGKDTVDGFYPVDHTHTSPEGAQVVADAFLKAVVCAGVNFKEALAKTDFEGECL